jgi:hypothetical protein
MLRYLASIPAAFLVAELFVRIHLFGASTLSYSQMKSMHTLLGSELIGEMKDAPYFSLKPNLDTLFLGKSLQTNSFAMRSTPVTLEKPPQVIRLAVIGDSLAMGYGVEAQNTFSELLARKIEARIRKNIETLNFAVGGYELNDNADRLINDGLRFSPDFVLIAWSLPGDLNLAPSPRPRWNPSFIKRLFPAHGNGFFLPWLYYYFFTSIPNGTAGVQKDVDWTRVEEQISRIHFESKRKNAVVYHVLLPQLGDLAESARQSRSQLLPRLKGAPVIDLINSFDQAGYAQRSRDFWVHRYNDHPNEEANSIFAELISRSFFKESSR